MTTNQQYEIYLDQLSTRKRRPVKPATISAYRSFWRTWVQPKIGHLDLSLVENGTMKKLVAHLISAGLAPSSIASVVQLVKGIVASAVDGNGNALYPRVWNSEFIDAPIIDRKDQTAPTMGREAVSRAISRTQGQFRRLCILLAGTGLRINEALAVKIGPQADSSYWDPKQSKIVIRTALYLGKEQSPKTSAGIREVDLAPELNDYLKKDVGRQTGYLFQNKYGDPAPLGTLYDKMKLVDVPGFHSLRRFRITHLENIGIPRTLVQFWAGHSGKGITDRYCKLDKDFKIRKEWATKAGLGFNLPKEEICRQLPYMKDVFDEEVEIRICDNCYSERAAAI